MTDDEQRARGRRPVKRREFPGLVSVDPSGKVSLSLAKALDIPEGAFQLPA